MGMNKSADSMPLREDDKDLLLPVFTRDKGQRALAKSGRCFPGGALDFVPRDATCHHQTTYCFSLGSLPVCTD